MTEEENKTITVNDKSYNVEDLSEQEIVMLKHVADLDQKLMSARFSVDQLQVARDSFVGMLTNSLENPTPAEKE
jgi:cell division protein ZapA (FtsZ GTPase activity inhibitor)|tara:strand:+ start:1324 stop:1545 length:222 start_codon:yes stop_codon:yes gene_type:complete